MKRKNPNPSKIRDIRAEIMVAYIQTLKTSSFEEIEAFAKDLRKFSNEPSTDVF